MMKLRIGSMGQWSLVPLDVKKEALISLYLTAAITLAAVVYYFVAQPQLPIFYTLPLASGALANKAWMLLFPVISFLITLLQLIMIGIFKDLDVLILKLYAWMTAFIQAMLLLVVFRIMLITI